MVTPHPFRVAVEARDHAAMVEQLAPDVVFHTPGRFKPIEGRDAVGALLGVILDVLADFRYTGEATSDELHALPFSARVGDREVEGIDLLRHDADGRIADFTVMIRPLSGLQAVAAAMGERLAEFQPSS
jgi:hypothetical protein